MRRHRFLRARRTWMVIAIVIPGLTACVTADDKRANVPGPFAAAFAAADKNNDQQLTLEEFSENRSPKDVAKRDFQLFDFNEDGTLGLSEFAAVPDVVPGLERGPLPDPLLGLVDQFVAGLDKSFGNWNERPNVEIKADLFLQTLTASFENQQVQFDKDSADADSSGKISRAEARRFLEIQLSVRQGAGKLLRRPNGQVVNYVLYMHIDHNKNGVLERSEFVERSYSPGNPEQEFDAANTNKDDSLSIDEFGQVPGRGIVDPVLEFRGMDTSLDAKLSPAESVAGMVGWKEKLGPVVFPGFDVNRDGELSLAEYQLTPQANMVLHWTAECLDADGDGMLSFVEFQLDRSLYLPTDQFQFPLLRFVYFQRLDLNSDGHLDPEEYFYKRRVPDELFVMNEDGTGWKSQFLFKGHSACGSVAVSPDGKSIAFDSWPAGQQGGSAIYVMELERNNPRQLCSGMMPTWSQDGRFLTCSRGAQPSGVWMIDLANDNLEHLCPGWGAQWSPDGRRIAFSLGQEMKIFDIPTNDFQTVLDQTNNPYQSTYWNMGWSPDGARLCFKGTKGDGTHEVASVSTVDGMPDLKVHHSGKLAINADFGWHPKGDRIIFAMQCIERGFTQLYEFNPQKSDPPVLVVGQDKARNNTDVSWTPDGKRLFIVSGDF
jgi:TolB protein